MSRSASVIVRAKDRARSIERTLRAVRDQSVPAELVVVDSGSTDGTLEIARRYADLVIEVRPEEFSYGGALNRGARAASGDVHFALSAHSLPLSSTWIEDSLGYYDRPDVAGTNAAKHAPTGEPLRGVYFQTPLDVVRHPWWGFSNHGSSWRADVWRQLPFREDLPATEDKEWTWRVLARGWTIAYAPELGVSDDHRRGAGLLPYWRRIEKERGTTVALRAAPPLGAREAVREWWNPVQRPGYRPVWVRRFSPYRNVEIAATYVAGRRARPIESSIDEVRAAAERQLGSGRRSSGEASVA